MPTESTAGGAALMKRDWTALQGLVLEGGYQLGQLLEADPGGATFRVRFDGDSDANAFARVMASQREAADEQLRLLESARGFQHPNLNAPLAVGKQELEAATLLYVILKQPDETLSDIVPTRALTVEESRDLLRSCARALRYLHERGFAHGCVSPEQIVAMGESIKLSTHCIRRMDAWPQMELDAPRYVAPESRGQNISAAADVWCLGATLFEVLTQRECGPGCREQAAKLPKPFGGIAQRCLDPNPNTRLQLGEIELVLQPVATSARAPVAPLAPRALPESLRNSRMWVYAAAGLLLIVLLIVWARGKRPTGPAPTRPAPSSAAQTITPSGATVSSHPQPVRGGAKGRVPEAAQQTAQTKNGAAPTVNGNVWRVVLFTYKRAEDAQNKVRALNETYPGLGAEAFSPNGRGGPVLVTAGGRMNLDDANRLWRKVRSMGLPQDSYIQNYRR